MVWGPIKPFARSYSSVAHWCSTEQDAAYCCRSSSEAETVRSLVAAPSITRSITSQIQFFNEVIQSDLHWCQKGVSTHVSGGRSLSPDLFAEKAPKFWRRCKQETQFQFISEGQPQLGVDKKNLTVSDNAAGVHAAAAAIRNYCEWYHLFQSGPRHLTAAA